MSTPVSIRFDPEIYDFVSAEASRLGVSAAEFIRSAALARACLNYARRTGANEAHDLYEAAHRLLVRNDPIPSRAVGES